MYSSIDGHLNNFHLVHLGQFALRGAGLIIQEATAVVAEGRISPRDAGLWCDEHIEGSRKVVEFVKSVGNARIGIQLGHAGRKGSTYPPFIGNGHSASIPLDALDVEQASAVGVQECRGFPTVGPSAIEYSPEIRAPTELSTKDIQGLIRAFVDSAVRANAAGSVQM
jgi:2,4-dienoyl-CoA reductase-like NADH-dependent reductase (Old Yellow Enzyme family)